MSLRNIPLYALVVAVVSCAGCGKQQAVQKSTAESIPVKVMKVRLDDLKRSLEYVGNIKAADQVTVYPKVSGKIVEKIRNEGDPVEKGGPIVSVDRDEVGLTYKHAPVESPLKGIVGRVYVDIGANVTAQTPVALVVSMDSVKIQLDIPEKYLAKLFVGQLAEVTTDAYPGEVFAGAVDKVSPVVDIDNRSVPIEILVDNKDHRLKSGMFARVTLALEEHKGVPVVLKEALIGKEPHVYVYVVEKSRAILKEVQLGIHQASLYEITGGLTEGEEVVIVGQQRLTQDAQVTVEYNGHDTKGAKE